MERLEILAEASNAAGDMVRIGYAQVLRPGRVDLLHRGRLDEHEYGFSSAVRGAVIPCEPRALG